MQEIRLTKEQKERYINAKDSIYKRLYLSDTRHLNIGILNLVNLKNRSEEQRKEIALKGNKASIQARRIKKGIKLGKETIDCYRNYKIAKDKFSTKDRISKRNANKLGALNRKYERKENRFINLALQIDEQYNVDLLKELEKQLETERHIKIMLAKKLK